MAESSVQQQIVDTLKDSSNILVTVSSNPTVDELSAALGITLFVNKMNKHATAVFSGEVPSALEFLEPEKTFEDTVDSLRDFIIALDKEKADHLRYKVDGDVVKIFITPYRTVLSENDLDFSQGDYNVELVIAIGVKSEDDLDKALSAHGRILHDAAVASLSLDGNSKLGTLNWNNSSASSYCEMLVSLVELVKDNKDLLDEQIATAFLTGIVAATERFSNNKTTSDVMSIAAKLMSAGANQQLIATKLEEADEIPGEGDREPAQSSSSESDKSDKSSKSSDEPAQSDDDGKGGLTISHEKAGTLEDVAEQVAEEKQQAAAEAAEEKLAEQLAANTPAVAPARDIQKDLAAAAPDAPLRGAVSVDRWKKPDESAEPSLGGTLNATTEQAAVDKQREIEDDRNRTILSHDGSHYVSDTPTFQAPMNAVSDGAEEEPSVPDVLNDSTTATTSHADTIQPPAPVAAAPTLAEIDAQNRARHTEALSDVHAAFEETPLPAPSAEVQPAAPAGAPVLPPLPPMPDFSTLPPLPPGMQPTPPAAVQDQPLGNSLPPAAPMTPPAPTDPGQFRIPGQ